MEDLIKCTSEPDGDTDREADRKWGRALVRVNGWEEVPTDIPHPEDPSELVKYHLTRRAEAFDFLLDRHADLADVGLGFTWDWRLLRERRTSDRRDRVKTRPLFSLVRCDLNE